LLTSSKNTISRLLFSFLFIYLLIGLLDFSGYSCFSNKHHKLIVSFSKHDTDAATQSNSTTFFIEEEDLKENELKKNCSSFSFFATHFFSTLTFEKFNSTHQDEFLFSRFLIPIKQLLRLNCILRI
jgi:hypothetical protein